MCEKNLEGQYAVDDIDISERRLAKTFTIRIFQWVPRASKKGLKKSKGVWWIRGPVTKRAEVEARAHEVCRLLNEGKSPLHTRKKETIK